MISGCTSAMFRSGSAHATAIAQAAATTAPTCFSSPAFFAGAPREHEAVSEARGESSGEFSGGCEAAEHAVDDEHSGTDAEPHHGNRRNRHAGFRALLRIALRISTAAVEHLPNEQCEQETVETENGARHADVHANRMGREIDQTREDAGREIDRGESQPADETLENRAELDQHGDVDEEMKHPECTNVDVRRRHHSPFVVRVPTLAPQPTSVFGSPIAPAPKSMPPKTTTLTATSASVTNGWAVRARSAAQNDSNSGPGSVAASFSRCTTLIA